MREQELFIENITRVYGETAMTDQEQLAAIENQLRAECAFDSEILDEHYKSLAKRILQFRKALGGVPDTLENCQKPFIAPNSPPDKTP